VRALLPEPSADVDLPTAYAYPPDGPWVRANMVSSVDGAIAVRGRSGGLSSPGDKRVFAALRDLADVVLVAAGTVRAEGYGAVPATPERVARRRSLRRSDVPPIAVVTSSLALDPASALFVDAATPTLVVTTDRAAGERGAAFRDVADLVTTPGDRVDLAMAVRRLVERGLGRVLCEGGPSLLGQLAAADVLDELCLTLSARLVSGDASRCVTGPALDPPVPMRLAGLLEEDGTLFTRWRTIRSG
jgi:riboflavin biosynthesis pyrimidine reductase